MFKIFCNWREIKIVLKLKNFTRMHAKNNIHLIKNFPKIFQITFLSGFLFLWQPSVLFPNFLCSILNRLEWNIIPRTFICWFCCFSCWFSTFCQSFNVKITAPSEEFLWTILHILIRLNSFTVWKMLKMCQISLPRPSLPK